LEDDDSFPFKMVPCKKGFNLKNPEKKTSTKTPQNRIFRLPIPSPEIFKGKNPGYLRIIWNSSTTPS